jgi:hypothetical protein
LKINQCFAVKVEERILRRGVCKCVTGKEMKREKRRDEGRAAAGGHNREEYVCELGSE